MFRIGRMPGFGKSFFRPLREHFHRRAWAHFWRLVVAICVGHGATVDRLARLLRDSTHRTNHGEFLWRSDWDEAAVLQQTALATLRRLMRGAGKRQTCYLIFDDTQTAKRARAMEAVGKVYHHATKCWTTGHLILKAVLYYRGVTMPLGTWLYLNPEHAASLGLPFRKRTQLMAQAIDQAKLPKRLKVIVLFDALYLCPTVTHACARRRWHWVSKGKSNRRFTPDTQPHGPSRHLLSYGRNLMRRRGAWRSVKGLRQSRDYRLAERIGRLRGLGRVKVVFSRRRGERTIHLVVTDNLRGAAATIVSDYLQRWAIELLIKEQKQHLGMSDYRVLRRRAVVRHLHLVDIAYACLTHMALQSKSCAQSQTNNHHVLHLPPISQLKQRARQHLWQETVKEVIRTSHERPVIRRLEKLLAA